MALYHHVFNGNCPSGDSWSFSWWASSASDTGTLQSAAIAWVTAVWNGPGGTNGFGARANTGLTANTVRTSLVNEATGQQLELAEGNVSLAGSQAGASLPADVAVCVSLRTNLANRRGRGRMYLPCPAVAQVVTTGKLSTGAQTDFVNALSAAWTTYKTTGTPVVYSRVNRDTADIVSFNIGDLFDTQRRRENKLVENRVSHAM